MSICHFFANGRYLTLEGDSSYIHSLSFKCEGLTRWDPLQKCKNIMWSWWSDIRNEDRFIFFKSIYGLCRGENRYLLKSLWPIMLCPLSRKQMVRVSMHERMHLTHKKLVRWKWWPMLACYLLGLFAQCVTMEDFWTVKAHLCFVL